MNARLLVAAAEMSEGSPQMLQLVLLRIAALADKHGVFRGGQDQLAEAASCSTKIVSMNLVVLEELGWVQRETTTKANGRRGPDRIKLTLSNRNDVPVARSRQPEPRSGGSPDGKSGGSPERRSGPIEDTLKGGDRDQQFSRRTEDEKNDNAPPDGPVKPGPRLTLHRGGKAA